MADVALTRSDLLVDFRNPAGSKEVLLQSAKELPSAARELANEAWDHPLSTVLHAAETTVMGVAFGGALGYLVPGRGPCAAIIGAAFTIPALVGGYRRLNDAALDAQSANANIKGIAHGLARDTVSSAANFVMGSAGGLLGSSLGSSLAMSETSFGRFGQSAQRLVLRGENKAMSGMRSVFGTDSSSSSSSSSEFLSSKPSTSLPKPKDIEFRDPNSKIEKLQFQDMSWSKRRQTLLSNRIDQFEAGENKMSMYYGSLHGHSVFSDGMDHPKDIFQKGKSQGWDFTTVTDHNHTAARAGVPSDDPRFPGHQKTTSVAEDPIHYTETKNAARDATENGKFVALYGVEAGTTGKPGSTGQAGVNHINILQTETFFQSVKQPRSRVSEFFDPLRDLMGIAKPEPVLQPPDVVKIADGNYKVLVDHLDQTRDSSGGRPVIQLNHPRYSEDESPSLPKAQRGRDYGQKSFDSRKEWVDRFGKYASQIELISGDALKQDSGGEILAKHIHAEDFAGYIDKGLRISPTFGRDFHFGDPGGTKAATGIMASELNTSSLLDALRARRTIATTNHENLSGNLVVNNVHPMGSVLDQSAVQDLQFKVNVGGKITPDSQYTAILWADKRIGDGKLATAVQTVKLSGQELIDAGNQVSFEQIRQTLGVKSAYYAEVQRIGPNEINGVTDSTGSTGTSSSSKAPKEAKDRNPTLSPDVEIWLGRSTIPTFERGNYIPPPPRKLSFVDPFVDNASAKIRPDRMWTAPVWSEPLAGQNHSLAIRGLVGIGSTLFQRH